MAEATAGTYRWSREAYDRAVDAGVFGPEDRIELIDGEIVGDDTAGKPARRGGDHGRRSVRIYRHGDRVAPLARPGTAIAVDDLLP